MDINSFLPTEDTIKFIELTGFSINTPYVFIQIKRIKENIIRKYNELDSGLDAEFYANLVKNGIYTDEEVFDTELLLTLKDNIGKINGVVLSEAFVLSDIVDFIYSKYSFHISIILDNGFKWQFRKEKNGVVYTIESNIKYNDKQYTLLSAINFFIENFNKLVFNNE